MSIRMYLFTDGSCGTGDDSVGTWAAYAVNQQTRKLLYGVAYPTTISRCELIPIIEGIRWITNNSPVGADIHCFSDSEYTIKTLSGMYPAKKNTDLWKGLDEVRMGAKLTYHYRERNSHPCMEICDSTCYALRETVKEFAIALFKSVKEPELVLPIVTLPEIKENL